MASPTEAEMNTQLQKLVAAYDNNLTQVTLPADIDAFEQVLEGDFNADMTRSVSDVRISASAAQDAFKPAFETLIQSYCKHVVGKPYEDIEEAKRFVYEWWRDNSKSINGHTMASYSASAISGTGDGLMSAQIVDDGGTVQLLGASEAVVYTVIRASGAGAEKNQEVWQAVGAGSGDSLGRVAGKGVNREHVTKNSNDSLLKNASFSSYSTAGSPVAGTPYTLVAGDSLSSWTSDDVTKLQVDIDTANQLQSNTGDTTPTSVRILSPAYIQQTFGEANISLDPRKRYAMFVGLKKESLYDRALTVTVGAKSSTVAAASVSTSMGLVFVSMASGADYYGSAIAANDAVIKLAVSGGTVGELVIDDVCFLELDEAEFGGDIVICAGATPFEIDDTFTHTHTVSAYGKIQYALAQSIGAILPTNAAGAETLADPA